MLGSPTFITRNTMDFLKTITSESLLGSSVEENTIAINTGVPENPYLEYYKSGEWIPLDNLSTKSRMARLDDLYTQLYYRNWCVGPRLSEKFGDLYLHTELQDSQLPILSGGIRISECLTSDELTDDMNKEIDIYYDSLISARDLLGGSSVVDLWEYPTEYGGTLNLTTISSNQLPPIIQLCVVWVIDKERKSETLTFSPWSVEGGWSEFQSFMGDSEVVVEFHDGCIRVFPNNSKVTECIIHHCSAIYDKLL